MSPSPTSDTNQPPNDGTRARANTVASVTASSTMGDIVSLNPSTPITPQDNDVDDEYEDFSPQSATDTPAGQGRLVTPQTQHLSRLSISALPTRDNMDQVKESDEPKVTQQLMTSNSFVPGDTLSSPSSVVTHGLLAPSMHVGANAQTDAVHQSPDSDPFEFDDNVSPQPSVEHHEPLNHSDHIEADDRANVELSSNSDLSNSSSDFSTNATTTDPEENDDTDGVQQSSISDRPDSPGSNSTTVTTTDPDENRDASVVQHSPTSHQSEISGSTTADSRTVDTTPTPALTTPSPAEFSLDQFEPIVRALADLSPPSTFDGDIVMPDGQDLKLYICEKGYDASFKHEEDDEDGQARPIDESKEQHYGFRRLTPRVWNDIVNFPPLNMALGDASQKDKAYREMKADQFTLKPDLIAASGIAAVIKEQLKQQGKLSLDTNDATLRVCTVGAWNGTDASSILSDGHRIGTIVLGLPAMSETGDIVVRKTAKSQQGKVVFDWSKQWMSQDSVDVRPRWMYFPTGTRYTIENACDDRHRDSGKNDVHFVIEYPVYVDGSVKHVRRPTRPELTKTLVKAFWSIIKSATQDFRVLFILSRPAKLGKGTLVQLENELDDRHSIQPDAVLYKALKDLGLRPTLEHVDNEPINPVSENYPRVMPTVEADFPARVRDEAKKVISLTYDKSKPVVLIGAPILDDAENVGGRVVMTVEIPKAKESVEEKENVVKKDQTGLHAH